MILKKILCLISALCVALCAVGCRSNTDGSSSLPSDLQIGGATREYFSVLCCYSDSFNPYTAETEINRNLSRLIFDPLLKLDNNYEPIYCLAQSVEMNGTALTVRLKNATFTDGSAVAAADVVYSYNLARASGTVYATQLGTVASAVAADGMTVVFNLKRYDPYFERLLDFPILKSGSDKRTDIDDVVLPPIGSGRYYPSDDGTRLIRNDQYFAKKSNITEIRLINSPDAASVSHYVEVGATDFYYTDISDGNIVRMSGKKLDINLNQLVYIGINQTYGQLNERNMRYAIAAAIDRTEICSLAFYNNAQPATGFFPSYFKDAASVQTLEKTANLQITVENLEKIGYNKTNDAGLRINSSGNSAVYTLLVNRENASRVAAANLIAQQLSRAGLSIRVVAKSTAEYIADLQSGNFQLYLGEIRVPANMDLSALVMPAGGAAYGIPATSVAPDGTPIPNPIVQTVNAFYSGTASISDTAGVLITEMPSVPVCYRGGLLFYDNAIGLSSGEDVSASRSDIFLSCEDYLINKK